MASYDGPSYFKKNHPKLKNIQQSQKEEKEAPRYTLPSNVQTRQEIQKKARQYMQTPSPSVPNDPPPERYTFKGKHIPASLQRLDGWSKQQVDVELYTKIHDRLQKEENTYLLFEEHLSDEMKAKLEEKQSKPPTTSKVEEKQVTLVRESMPKELLKPGTGLHRSLSNIMADEQKTIHKNQNSLDKLFNQDAKKKKNKKR